MGGFLQLVGGRCSMAYKVKSFGMEIRPMKTMQELQQLDEMVNSFVAANNVKKLISVSDAQATDDTGETIGLIRVIAYED
jgi:hypothetical protein